MRRCDPRPQTRRALLEGGARARSTCLPARIRPADGWIIVALVREDDFTRLRPRSAVPNWPRTRATRLRGTRRECSAADRGLGAVFPPHRPDSGSNGCAPRIARRQGQRLRLLARRPACRCNRRRGPLRTARHGPVLHAARTPGVPADIDRSLAPAPAIGEHSRVVLAELGLDMAAIAGLAADGVLRLGDVA